MKAKRITALLTVLILTALTLTAALSACGKKNIELVQSGTENETESKVSKETKETTEEVTEDTTEKITDEVTERVSETEAIPETVPESITEMATEMITEKVTEKPTEKATEKVTNPPVIQQQTEAPAPVNVHTHSWKDHVATTQTWIPNMVTVDDYEDQIRETFYEVCKCGFRVDEDYGGVRMAEHMENSALAVAEKARNEGRNPRPDEFTCGSYLIYTDYVTERVKVGSHTEDHGHYEESTYVDYQYCDCGAIK